MKVKAVTCYHVDCAIAARSLGVVHRHQLRTVSNLRTEKDEDVLSDNKYLQEKDPQRESFRRNKMGMIFRIGKGRDNKEKRGKYHSR